MELAFAHPPWRLAFAALVASAVAATRPAAVVLRSETELRQFGLALAASGPVIATVDRTSRAGYVLRIDRVAGTRPLPEGRIPLGDLVMVPSIDVRGDVAAASLDSHEVRFYAYHPTAWVETQRLALSAACSDSYFNRVHLGAGVVVVESREVWCVFERTAGKWALSTMIPHTPGTEIGVSRGRVILGDLEQVDQFVHERAGWTRTTLVTTHGVRWLDGMATSDRWLVLRDAEGTLTVHDLDDGARLRGELRTVDGRSDVTNFGVGPRALAITGDGGARAWRFVDDAWIEGGRLDVADERAPNWLHRVTIGELIWVGHPALGDDASGGGSVHGFRIDP